jgi:hypothetical protein
MTVVTILLSEALYYALAVYTPLVSETKAVAFISPTAQRIQGLANKIGGKNSTTWRRL